MSMTVDPGARGARNASRQNENDIQTSVSQLTENCSQVSSCSGRPGGLAPAQRITTSGRRAAKILDGAAWEAASMAKVFVPDTSCANWSSGSGVLPTARTLAPSAAILRTIARPTPPEAPTTTTFLPAKVTIGRSSGSETDLKLGVSGGDAAQPAKVTLRRPVIELAPDDALEMVGNRVGNFRLNRRITL